MKRVILVLFIVVLVISAPTLADTAPFSTQDVEIDETVTKVDIHENSDATFVFEIKTRLENTTEEEAFKRFQERVAQNESEVLSDFRNAVSSIVARAENSTGREMSASNFSVETELKQIPRELGIVRYRFYWSNFSKVSNDTITVDETLSGYILSQGDSLVITYPSNYVVTGVSPQPDSTTDNRLVWEGPREFGAEEPRVVLELDSSDGTDGTDGNGSGDGTDGGTDGGTAGGTDGGTDGDTDGSDGTGGDGEDGADGEQDSGGIGLVTSILGALIVLTLIGASGYYWFVMRSQEPGEGTKSGEGIGEQIQEQNLSDTELVTKIIEDADGRIKQKDVVEKTGWSEAKVSQVTTKLEDEGVIQKLRMGRENILQMAEEDE